MRTNPGIARLEAALGHPVRIDRGEEEHVETLDELPVTVVEVIADVSLRERVGEPTGVEAVLQGSLLGVIRIGHGLLLVRSR